MATSSTQGGGFLVGALYGLIASTALYLVLVYVFPIEIQTISTAGAAAAPVTTSAPAPEVMDSTEGGGAGQGAVAATEGPAAPEMAVPEMVQPEAEERNTATIGGGGDAGPAPMTVASAPVVNDQGVNAPDVTTAPLPAPDIGNGTQEAVPPGTENTAPPAPAGTTPAAPAVSNPTTLASSRSGPAIEVFAAPFAGDTSKPKLAIVLEDTMEASLQPLVESGKPFSFALPAGSDSRDIAQAIRESGFEVLAMIPPDATQETLTPEAMARYMQNVPVAVAVLDSDSTTVMLNRASMQVVLESAVPAGLGLISYSGNGVLIAQAQADQAGAIFGKAVPIPPEFDDEELIIQALNQAAFVAGTNDRAIVFAKTNQATINGILRWLNSARASQLELVPVSVALQSVAN